MLDYVHRYESNSIKPVGSGYRSKEHESLAISDKGFFWHSNGVGGKTALDYLIAFRSYDFVSAVCHLINETSYEKGNKPNEKRQGRSSPKPLPSVAATAMTKTIPTQNNPKSEPQTIALPRRNKNNYEVIAYLQNPITHGQSRNSFKLQQQIKRDL